MQPTPLEALCLDCGLCCDGSLFEAVLVTESEAGQACWASHTAGGGPGISPRVAQPCPMLHGQTCTIYAQRPETCRRYECGLYTRVSLGELAEDEARREIADFKSLIRRATQRLPDDGESTAPIKRLTRAAERELYHGEGDDAVDDLLALRELRARFVEPSP